MRKSALWFVVLCGLLAMGLMVRKSATRAIVNHAGMELLDEQLIELYIDLSQDDRPLINAIRGESQSDVWATKRMTVRLTEPELDADELILTQAADIQPDSMRVDTVSDHAAGKLDKYAMALTAKQSGQGTVVALHVEMQVRVVVLKVFISTADRRVQQAAVEAVSEQAAAIKEFIAKYAAHQIILP